MDFLSFLIHPITVYFHTFAEVEPGTLECDELNIIFELPSGKKRADAVEHTKAFLKQIAGWKLKCERCLRLHITVADAVGLRHVVDGSCSTKECVIEGSKTMDIEVPEEDNTGL